MPAANCTVRSDRSWPTHNPATCDQHHHHLPVDGVRRQLHHRVRSGQAGRELGEHRRDRRGLHPGLVGVGLIVQSDGEHLTGHWRRTAEVGQHERDPTGDLCVAGERHELLPLVVDHIEPRAEPAIGQRGHVNSVRPFDQDGSPIDVPQLHV